MVRSLRILLFAFVFLCQLPAIAQLTIVSGGQTTPSASWSVSGTNPVTITVTASVSIAPSVIESYLNSGKSVIVETSSTMDVQSSILRSSGSSSLRLTLKSATAISVSANTSISATSGPLDVIVWTDSDNSQAGAVNNNDQITLNAGSTIATKGGLIVLAGGLDNGSNAETSGDGIPDNNAYRGSTGAAGINLGTLATGGTAVSLSSEGGDIIIRGQTRANANYPAVTSQANLKIDAVAGRVKIQGVSSVNDGVNLSLGADPSIAISSSYSGVDPAIKISGGAVNSGYGLILSERTAGNILIQSTATSGGGIRLEGTNATSNSYTALATGVEGTNMNVQLLAASGSINLVNTSVSSFTAGGIIKLKGAASIGYRSSSTSVQGITPLVSSTAVPVYIIGDDVEFDATKTTTVNTSGSCTIAPGGTAFRAAITVSNVTLSGVTGLTIGSVTNTANITISSNVSVAGPVNIYGGYVNINSNITTTAAGNIYVYGSSSGASVEVQSGKFITKTAGSGNVTLKGNGQIISNGSLTASGTAKLNVLLWAEADGGTSNGIKPGTITTNGGHVWMGGGSSSVTWNGLSVGSGAAYGGGTLNQNAIDLTTTISTGGGDVLISAWTAASLATYADIGGYSGTPAINAGSGNVTLLTRSSDYGNNVDISITTTGILTLAPVSGQTYSIVELTWTGAMSGADFNGSGDVSGLLIKNFASLGGLSLGTYKEGAFYSNQNTKNLLVSDHISINGPVTLYGVLVDVGANITTNNKDIFIHGANTASGGVRMGFGTSQTLNSGTGNVTIQTDRMAFDGALTSAGAYTTTITCAGILTIRPNGTAFTFETLNGADGSSANSTLNWTGALSGTTWAITSGDFKGLNITNFANLKGLTLQSTGITTPVSIDAPINISGTISIFSGTLAINAALTNTNGNISLNASGAITQTAAITASGLALLGAGASTLTHANNAIKTFAAGSSSSRVGAVSFVNNGALTIGSVNPTGVYSSGDVYIATTNGQNINLTAPVNTTSTTASAIRIYADQGASAGTASGGQIIVNGGSVNTGSGGYTKLFSGNVASSTGLNALASSTTNVLYNKATNNTLANAALGISIAGSYVIYRDLLFELTNLTVSSGTLSPTFSAAERIYSVAQSSAPASFSFTPTSGGGTLYISENNGTSYAVHTSGNAFTDNSINSISNKYLIQVRDAAGSVVKTTYTLTLVINQTTVPAASGTWRDYFAGAAFDPNDDQQAVAETDLVGNATSSMLQSQQQSVSISNTNHKVYYFRVRLGNTGTPKTSGYLGIDVNRDKKLDMVVEANLKATTPYVSYHKLDPSKDGSGPSQTSWLNSTTNTNIERRLATSSARITNYTATTDLDGPSVGGTNTGTDTWLEFAFTENSLISFVNDALGQNITGSTIVGLTYFTSTSQTANGDIGGVDDRTADMSKTWPELGIITYNSLEGATGETDLPYVDVESTQSVNSTATVYGVWNGSSFTSPSLTVVINGVSYYYNVSGKTNSISLSPLGWYLTASGLEPGTYSVNATMETNTGVQSTSSGSLLVTDVFVRDLITSDVTPQLSGYSTEPDASVSVDIKSGSTVVATYTTTTQSTMNADGSYTLTVDITSSLSEGTYTVETTLSKETSTSTHTSQLQIIATNPILQLDAAVPNPSGSSKVVNGTSTITSGNVTLRITGPNGYSSTQTVAVSGDGSWTTTLTGLSDGDYYVEATIPNGMNGDATSTGNFAVSSALPVTWIHFSGKQISTGVELNWATASEQNNGFYEIQRALNGSLFQTIGKIQAAANAAIRNDYRFLDHQPLDGRISYRLKQVDLDGKSSYSSVVTLQSIAQQKIKLWSAIGSQQLQVQIPATMKGRFDLKVFDASGRLLQRQWVESGYTRIELDRSAAGVVFVRIMKEGEVIYVARMLQ